MAVKKWKELTQQQQEAFLTLHTEDIPLFAKSTREGLVTLFTNNENYFFYLSDVGTILSVHYVVPKQTTTAYEEDYPNESFEHDEY